MTAICPECGGEYTTPDFLLNITKPLRRLPGQRWILQMELLEEEQDVMLGNLVRILWSLKAAEEE